MWTNADAVEAFFEAHRGERWKAGDRLVLPDIGQVYEVLDVRVFRPQGKVDLWLDLEAECAVRGCGNRFVLAMRVRQWRQQLYLTRCCDEHRRQWHTPMAGAWSRGADLARQAERKAEVARKVAAFEAAEAERLAGERERLGIAIEAQGSSERAVLDAFMDLGLVYEAVPPEALLRAAVDNLEAPTGGKRDTRRQSAVRALNSLMKRGVLRAGRGGVISGDV